MRTFSAFLLMSLASATGALESDFSQEVLLSSDGNTRMSISGETRFVELNDNVKVTQGSLTIEGDFARVEYNMTSGEVEKVTVTGSPVHYSQQLNSDGDSVTGSSETLMLYTSAANQSVVELQGSASITSPESSMRCVSIIYISELDLIQEATGPCQGVLFAPQD